MISVPMISIVSADNSDANFDASDLWANHANSLSGGNFNRLSKAIYPRRLNSDNYQEAWSADSTLLSVESANFGFLSDHFSQGGINTAVVSQSQINSTILSNSQVGHAHMNFKASDNGVRVVQAPINNLQAARASFTVSIDYTATNLIKTTSASIAFSNAIDGDPGFTAAPILEGRPMFVATISNPKGARYAIATNIQSSGASFIFGFLAATSESYTVHVGLAGKV